MENALLIGLSRQTVLARQLNIIANNMANIRTAGFKGENMMFEEHLMPVARVDDQSGNDTSLSYVIDNGLARNFNEGQFVQTGNPLDVAIAGKGWFVVQTPAGERYSRDGALKIGPDGQLVNGAGHPVLGDGGPVQFSPEDTNITIASDGTIASSQGDKGKLRVVRFDNEGALEKVGDNLFKSAATPQAAEDARLSQGMLERSNVQPVVETARMIEVTRAYVSTAKMMDQMQDLRRDAIERLGTVPN